MANQYSAQATVITQAELADNRETMQLALFTEGGDPFAQATEMPLQADVAALTQAAITGGESPTEAEFNALRADHAATRTTVNALLAKLKTAGLMASS